MRVCYNAGGRGGTEGGGFHRRVVVPVGPDGVAWTAEEWGKVLESVLKMYGANGAVSWRPQISKLCRGSSTNKLPESTLPYPAEW